MDTEAMKKCRRLKPKVKVHAEYVERAESG
jgi:hypothetical protein